MMKKLKEEEMKNVRGGIGVTDYAYCSTCGKRYSGWSLFGVVAHWVAFGRAQDCEYSHINNGEW